MKQADKFRRYGESVLAFRRILPDVAPGELLTLLEEVGKAEVSLSRIHERQCNGYQDWQHKWDQAAADADKKKKARIVEKLTGLLSAHGLGLRVNGDPRGLAVRVLMPDGSSNLWGGEGEWGASWVE